MYALFVEVWQELVVPLFHKRSSVWSADDVSHSFAMSIVDNEAVLGLQQVVGTAPGVGCNMENFRSGILESFIGRRRELGVSAQQQISG